MMFERFAGDARAAVVAAVGVAKELDSPEVGREHLLAGIAEYGPGAMVASGLSRDYLVRGLREGVGAPGAGDREALAAIGIDLDAIRDQVETQLGAGAWDAAKPARRRRAGPLARLLLRDHLPFSVGARKALELALREALAEHAKEISVIHLLRGLLRDPGPAATALVASRIELDELRAQIARPQAA
jgi:Clp amino terminal domain, pathogenicity island component